MYEKSVLLAPNELVPPNSPLIKYPVFASTKYDGNRMLIKAGQPLSRNFKPQPNVNIPIFFREILDVSRREGLVFDGEWYDHGMAFNEMQKVMRSETASIPPTMRYYVFDLLTLDEWNTGTEPPFKARYLRYSERLRLSPIPRIVSVSQFLCSQPKDVEALFSDSLDQGYEGLILRTLGGRYKHGRATTRDGIIFKLKQFDTLDCRITGFEQRRRMKQSYSDSNRDRDETGRLARSFCQENYEYIDEIGSVLVEHPETHLIFGVGFGREFDPDDVGLNWAERGRFIGRTVEIKYQKAGTYRVPRMGKIVRLRPDKD